MKYYINIKDLNHCKDIQKEAFQYGFKWLIHGKTLLLDGFDYNYICFCIDSFEMISVDECPKEEICETVEEILEKAGLNKVDLIKLNIIRGFSLQAAIGYGGCTFDCSKELTRFVRISNKIE